MSYVLSSGSMYTEHIFGFYFVRLDRKTLSWKCELIFCAAGQKGIGFKSVFRVTDCPEIHSNGFHIKFDVNSGPLGYILPHWIETEEDLCEKKTSSDKYAILSFVSLPLMDCFPDFVFSLARFSRTWVIVYNSCSVWGRHLSTFSGGMVQFENMALG